MMDINFITDAYAHELENWDFFSDSQRCYINMQNHIVVCLRNYQWYITKEPVQIDDIITCVKALFEIDWIAEYSDGYDSEFYIEHSKYWKKY